MNRWRTEGWRLEAETKRRSHPSWVNCVSWIAVLMLLRPAASGEILAHWNFDEKPPGSSASSTADGILDSSGNNRHFTAAGSPLPHYVTGAANFGGTAALQFTSGTDRVYASQTVPFNFGLNDSFTLEAVVRTAPGAVGIGGIVSRDWGANLPSWWFRVESGAPRFLIAQNGGPEPNVVSSILMNDGNWHHLAAVRDAAVKKLRIYVDYALAGEANDTLTSPPTNSQNLVVGAFNSGLRQFSGEIDFVRISSGALAPAEFVQTPLSIIGIEPSDGAEFVESSKGVRFNVISESGVDPSAIQFTLNGSNRSSELIITGSPTNREATFAGLKPDIICTALISAIDLKSNSVSSAFRFNTYVGDTTPVFVSEQDGYNTYRIPSLIVSPAGTLLAFCEGRKNSSGDSGDIDLLLKRSFDNGKTWGTTQLLWTDGDNTIGNPCPVVDRITGTIWLPVCRNNDRVFVLGSTNDGATWSSPLEITGSVKLPGWSWYATGPGVGIQLQQGPHAGRLVIPCDNKSNAVFSSHIIFSDDHGQSWNMGGLITPKMNECQVVELADGRLLMNMRNADSTEEYRAISTSADGGVTWSPIAHDPTLIEPICQASILRYTLASEFDRNRLLFSNPASTTSRNKMTIRLSYDEGQTWPVAKLLYSGTAAYSCLAVLPDATIGCLYERGAAVSYETITFSRFSLPWLADGVDRPSRRELQSRATEGTIILSWPVALSNAVLESTGTLNAIEPWAALNASPSLNEDRWEIALSLLTDQCFFRLNWTNESLSGGTARMRSARN